MALFQLKNSADNKTLRLVLPNTLIKEIVNKEYAFSIDCSRLKIGIPNNKMKDLLSYDKVEININKEDLFNNKEPIFSYRIKVIGDGNLINITNLMDLFVMIEDDVNINQLALYYVDKDNNLKSCNKFSFVPGHIVFPFVNDMKYVALNKTHNFEDIKSGELDDYINFLWIRGIVNGVDNGHFQSDKKITRAEFAALLNRYLDIQCGVKNNKNPFKDISDDDWFYEDLIKLNSVHIINGISKDEISPNGYLKKQDMIILFVKAYIDYFGVESINNNLCSEINYKDEHEISDYAKKYIEIARNIGLIECNDKNKELGPKSYARRDEVIKMMYEFVLNTLHLKYLE